MPIENVSGVKPFLAQVPKKEEVEQKIAQAQKEIKDGKKKLALTLAGLATVGVATIGVALAIKKGKIPSELTMDNFKKIGNFEKGKAFVKGKPYTGIIDVVNKNGKFQMEYVDGVLKSSTKSVENSESILEHLERNGLSKDIIEEFKYSEKMKKLYSEADGIKTVEKQIVRPRDGEWVAKTKTIIKDGNITRNEGELQRVAQKQEDGSWKVTKQVTRDINYKGYAIDTIDIKTGEIVDSKIGGTYKKPKKGKGGLLRKTISEINEAGNSVSKTYKNGKLYSTTETVVNSDGSKRIIIEYEKGISNKEGKEIIDIAVDGTRTVVQEAEHIFKM